MANVWHQLQHWLARIAGQMAAVGDLGVVTHAVKAYHCVFVCVCE